MHRRARTFRGGLTYDIFRIDIDEVDRRRALRAHTARIERPGEN
jgi:hypothetical protein